MQSLTAEERCYQYCEDIESGRIVSNKWVKLAIKRFRSDLEKSKKDDFPYFFDPASGEKFVKFTESLKQTNDKFRGQPLILQPWQCFIFMNIYGWKKKSDNCRRFSKATIMVARKNGKSTMLGSALLFDLMTTNGGQAMTLATKKDQAKIVYKVAEEMVKQSPLLSGRLKIYNSTSRIVNEAKASYITPMASESNKLDGLNPSCAVIDEIAAQNDMKLINVIQSGQGSRPEPLLLEISSCSDNIRSAGHEEWESCEAILEGTVENDSVFAMLYGLDEGDDWKNPKNDIKANPCLGVSVQHEFIQKFRKEAMQKASMEGEFRSKMLNQWISPMTAWIKASAWKSIIDNARTWERPSFSDCVCIAGVDLSQRVDFTAFSVYAFHPQSGRYFTEHHFYIPEEQIEDKMKKDSPLIKKWIEDGYITSCKGKTIRQGDLIHDLKIAIEKYSIREILYDPWNAGQLEEEVSSICDLIRIPQTIKEISPMAKDWEAAVLEKSIADDNPVMAWMVGNADIYTDANGNIKPTKRDQNKSSSQRIDGVITSLMCLGRIKQMIKEGFIDNRSSEEIEADMTSRLDMIDY